MWALSSSSRTQTACVCCCCRDSTQQCWELQTLIQKNMDTHTHGRERERVRAPHSNAPFRVVPRCKANARAQSKRDDATKHHFHAANDLPLLSQLAQVRLHHVQLLLTWNPYPPHSPRLLTEVLATTTKICITGGSSRAHATTFNAHRYATLLVGASRLNKFLAML